jgi:predicted transcriptional regulator
MPDEQQPGSANRQFTAEIVAAYVGRNQIAPDQLPGLISTAHESIGQLGQPTEIATKRTPAVPIRRSVQRDHVACIECGWKGSMLKRHLTTAHGLNVDEYRSRWNLPRDHAIVAPAYSERRSGLAKQLGLGRLGRGSRTTAAPKTPTPRRRPGQPRTPRS